MEKRQKISPASPLGETKAKANTVNQQGQHVHSLSRALTAHIAEIYWPAQPAALRFALGRGQDHRKPRILTGVVFLVGKLRETKQIDGPCFCGDGI